MILLTGSLELCYYYYYYYVVFVCVLSVWLCIYGFMYLCWFLLGPALLIVKVNKLN
jgi:hypothetical protein